MSYTINFDKWGDWYVEYKNLTLDKLCSDDEAIIKTEDFCHWFNDVNDESIDSYIQNNLYDDVLDQVESFKQSNAFLELQNSYTPVCNNVHILSTYVDGNRVKMISKHIGNVAIVHLNDADVDAIALTSYEMDFDDSIELAYYIADGKSPVIASYVASLDENAEKLLNFCRHISENCRVSMHEINQFIDSGYQTKKEK